MRTTLYGLISLVCVATALADGGGSVPRSSTATAIVDAGSLAEAGWRTWWRLHLPLSPAERVEAVHLVDEYLYALTDRKRLFAIRADTGLIRWQRPVGEPGDVFFPVTHALTGGKPGRTVITTAGWVALLDRETGRDVPFRDRQGRQRSRYALERPASSAAVADEKAFYVSQADRRFGAYTLSTGRPAWFCIAEAAGSTTPRIIPGRVLFAADSGELHMLSIETPLRDVWEDKLGTAPLEPVMALTSEERGHLWPTVPRATPVEPVFLNETDLIFTAEDRFVYSVDPRTGPMAGRCRWKRRLSTAPTEGPAVAGELVFQPDARDGIVALDRQTGRPRWHVPWTRRLLARTGEDATLLGDDGNLLIVDAATGRLRNRLRVAGARFAPSNLHTDAVYLADEIGEVVCVRPEGAEPLRIPSGPASKPTASAPSSGPGSETAPDTGDGLTGPSHSVPPRSSILQSTRF